jgi:hypothetical protein
MAKASAVKKTVEVTLTLSIEEASVLRTLLYRHVAGRVNGKRGLLDDIQSALDLNDVPLTELQVEGRLQVLQLA